MSFIKEWTHKEVEVLTRSFKRYSVYVIILKYVLPLTALCLAAALFIYPAVTGKGKKIVLVAQEQKNLKPVEAPVMAKPKFVGIDSNGQPYQISASRAVQESLDFTRLEKVNADMTLSNGSWVSGVASSGTYDSAKRYLILDGEVGIYMVRPDNSTYQATTTHMEIDMNTNIVTGDKPVQILTDSGSLSAEKFAIDKEKQKITFQGNVRLVILRK